MRCERIIQRRIIFVYSSTGGFTKQYSHLVSCHFQYALNSSFVLSSFYTTDMLFVLLHKEKLAAVEHLIQIITKSVKMRCVNPMNNCENMAISCIFSNQIMKLQIVMYAIMRRTFMFFSQHLHQFSSHFKIYSQRWKNCKIQSFILVK